MGFDIVSEAQGEVRIRTARMLSSERCKNSCIPVRLPGHVNRHSRYLVVADVRRASGSLLDHRGLRRLSNMEPKEDLYTNQEARLRFEAYR